MLVLSQIPASGEDLSLVVFPCDANDLKAPHTILNTSQLAEPDVLRVTMLADS